MPAQPTSVVHLRPDTIGDLVIFLPALARLQAAWPQARHTLVVRPGYDALAPLFPSSVRWLVAPLNPFKQRPAECRSELDGLLGRLEELNPDLLLASAPNRTWLEAAVAARFPAVRSVVLGRRAVDPIFATALRLDLAIDAARAFGETVPVDETERDWENQHRLADHLLGSRGERTGPSLAAPPEAERSAEAFLAGRGLSAGGWAAVFAGGLANVKVKAWRPEGFGELAAWLQQERKLPPVLMGHESEAEFVERCAAAAERTGAGRPLVWLGRDGELPTLVSLLRRARLYVGHDTAAMHLAAAVGRPTVGIFGGGHWPRFRPVGRQTLSVVQPLPCFGCNWDCHFTDGPCVKTLSAGDVREAVAKALEREGQPFDEALEVRSMPPEAVRLIAEATPRHLALQRDRLERQYKIEELKAESDQKDREIADLKRAAEERKAESDQKDAEIADLKQVCNEREAEADQKDREIADLKAETDGKDREIADLKRAAEERKAESDQKDAEIADLKQVCNEREALVIQQDGHIKHFQKAVAGLEQAVQEARAEAGRVGAILAKLPADAAAWADTFAAKDAHIRNLEAAAAERDRAVASLQAAVAEKDRSLANYAAGLSGLEQAKHYGRLLAEKDHALENLHRACVEREGLIRRLAAEATRPTARLGKLAAAAAGWWRARVALPLGQWLFRKAVEEYWMQIGILRHYDPRPIAWDRRIPRRPRLPDGHLPRIGLVTPCFRQAAYVESTMLSVLNQNYPKLLYVVQDGGSTDGSAEIAARHRARLHHFASAPDGGQADAIARGFARIEGELAPTDLMAWLNSDDFLAPRSLRLVGEYFARHPAADVVYGHRIIIDGEDREIGRWVMPRHNAADLEWIDYVPQETLFWRKRAWDAAGGIDRDFHFALDWDLLARFQRAGCRIERLPYFLGCFRIHSEQKTSQAIHTTGAEEMARIRARFHPGREQDFAAINAHARRVRFRGAVVARLMAAGVRW